MKMRSLLPEHHHGNMKKKIIMYGRRMIELDWRIDIFHIYVYFTCNMGISRSIDEYQSIILQKV